MLVGRFGRQRLSSQSNIAVLDEILPLLPDSRKEIPLLGEMSRSDKRVAVFAENVPTKCTQKYLHI